LLDKLLHQGRLHLPGIKLLQEHIHHLVIVMEEEVEMIMEVVVEMIMEVEEVMLEEVVVMID
jgi:hypothetical protein